MRKAFLPAGALALSVTLLTAACTIETRPDPVDLTGKVELVAYDDCDDMLTGLREATARNTGPWGIDGMVPATLSRADIAARGKAAEDATPAHSDTNVQEEGVDEPDLVKTDGRRIIVMNAGVLRVIDAASKKVTGTLRVAPKDEPWANGELFLHGDRALVMLTSGRIMTMGAMVERTAGDPRLRYVLVDLSGAAPKAIGTLTADGSHVDARMAGSTVRIVTRSRPRIDFPGPASGASDAERTAANRDTVRKAPLSAWLPGYTIDGQERTVKCERVSHPDDYTGTSMLTVHTIDLSAGLSSDEPISLAADGDTVYATATSLYVTSNPNWWRPIVEPPPAEPSPAPSATRVPSGDPSMPTLRPDPTGSAQVSPGAIVSSAAGAGSSSASPAPPAVTSSPLPATTLTLTATAEATEPPAERTEIHRFDITGSGPPRYAASAAVPGRLLNRYALSDYDGHLRVATTQTTTASSISAVYVLTADTLARTGEVGGLGRGERIYAVRFMGPTGYVVTFRQIDPLYVLDLRDPAAPKVTGELKISGYSAYLHPAGDGRLIGIGQEATEQGRALGTQVSLFDVHDPAAPALLARMAQKDSGSKAEWDPHAFLYWPSTGLAVLPLTSWRADDPAATGALVLHVTGTDITRTGVVTHPKPAGRGFAPVQPSINRSLIIGDTLWTVSDLGLKASDATTLAAQGWVPFPAE